MRKESSVTRLFDRTIAGLEAGTVPAYGLPCRLKDSEIPSDTILFTMLVDYWLGLPNGEEDQKLLVAEIAKSANAMHGKGVVHMDLYLSNIMWKKNEEEMGHILQCCIHRLQCSTQYWREVGIGSGERSDRE